MSLTLLHTAQVHVDAFNALRDRIAPDADLTHLVHEDWLAEARGGITAELEARLSAAIAGAAGPVVCTCTTLGPVAARHGAIRIDQPMMRRSVEIGGTTVMVIALESTLTPSRDLFISEGGDPDRLRLLDLTALWPLFENGRIRDFHAQLAGAVTADHTGLGGDAIVLAQASMAGAAEHLTDLPVPVLTSPELALRAALGR